MGKNKLRGGSGAEGNDHLIVPPAGPNAGLVDGQMSRWLVPDVGNYSSINCRMEIGKLPSPKDQNSPCPECCSTGQWDSTVNHSAPNNQTWHWQADEQWFSNNIVGFSAACWNFATTLVETGQFSME